MRLDHVPAEVGERQLTWWHGLLIGVMAVTWVVAAATVGGAPRVNPSHLNPGSPTRVPPCEP